MKCDACDMIFPEKNAIVGISIRIAAEESGELLLEEYQKQLAPYVIGKTYSVCYPCWLKSLGVKP